MPTTRAALELSLGWQRHVMAASRDPQQKARCKAAIERLEAKLKEDELPGMYARREPNGSYTLRQDRYRDRLARGKEHPHDVCAVATSLKGLREMCDPHWPDADYQGVE